MTLRIRRILPRWVRSRLWGDRERWGLVPDTDDRCWTEWQQTYGDFYSANQRAGVGTAINDAGYRVMATVDLAGKTVLEIGAGDIRHVRHWRSTPAQYLLADVDAGMLERAQQRLNENSVRFRSILLDRGETLPIADESVDVVVSFYSLEHLYPLRPYLDEMRRVLKPGGTLMGAIPAEGGFAWGAGRFLTSRRWFKKYTTIDPDKIICWEHPNFADEIIDELDRTLVRQHLRYWPFPWAPALDANLIIRFRYTK